MRISLKIIVALIFMFCAFNFTAAACTCVRDKIKVSGFTGRVFVVSESKTDYKEPLPKATVRLKDRNDKVIAELVTDENGNFSLETVKAGTYIFEVEARYYTKVLTEIKIRKKSNKKDDRLVIGLEPGLVCCGGFAKIE